MTRGSPPTTPPRTPTKNNSVTKSCRNVKDDRDNDKWAKRRESQRHEAERRIPFNMIFSMDENGVRDGLFNCYNMIVNGETKYFYINQSNKIIEIYFHDPIEAENYYRFFNSGCVGYFGKNEDGSWYADFKNKSLFDKNHRPVNKPNIRYNDANDSYELNSEDSNGL